MLLVRAVYVERHLLRKAYVCTEPYASPQSFFSPPPPPFTFFILSPSFHDFEVYYTCPCDIAELLTRSHFVSSPLLLPLNSLLALFLEIVLSCH